MLPGAEGVTTAREPAKHTSAYIANMSPSDCPLSPDNWFELYGTASIYPQCKGIGTSTQKGCLPVMGSLTDKLSLGKCLSLP